MTTETAKSLHSELDDEVREQLVAEGNLSSEAIDTIARLVNTTRTSFVDVALELGFVTKEQADAAVAAVRRLHNASATGSSVVTLAFGRQEPETSHAVRIGTSVAPGPQLYEAMNPETVRGETVRALRTELLLRLHAGSRNGMFSLVSAGSAEGRSQLCAELAISFAQLGRRTLLVDSDLRNPVMHHYFGVPRESGLAQAIGLGEPIHTREVQGFKDLSVVFSGLPVSNPLEMLTSPTLSRIVSQWRANYEFVILDTPPIACYADALLLAKLTGRALLLSRANVSRIVEVKDLVRRLHNTGAEIIGSVLSHF